MPDVSVKKGEVTKHGHSWWTELDEHGRVRFRSPCQKLRILQTETGWNVGRVHLTPENRFGIWMLEGSTKTLAEALNLASTLRSGEHNPYGICNSLWHTEAHSCHSTCNQCGRQGFDQELKDSYKVPYWKGPRGQAAMAMDGGPVEWVRS